MALASIQQLLKENEAELLRERRSADRKPFTRPVLVLCGKNQETVHEAFSRDISPVGIGLITRVEWSEGAFAVLVIHSVGKKVIRVASEVRWCQPYGDGWYVSGWTFLRERG